MKKSIVIILCLLVFVIGSTLGYSIGFRKAFHRIGDEMERDQMVDAQDNMQCEARGYLYSLQALDSGRTEDIADLRKRALGHLRVYVKGVQELRDRGYEWTPNTQIFSNVTVYLTQHPGIQ
jgi:hypothetical protein